MTAAPTDHHHVDVDVTGWPDADAVADAAARVLADIRDRRPTDVLLTLAVAARYEPVRTAQVCMALAAWVDPRGDVSTTDLIRRAQRAAMHNRINTEHLLDPEGTRP